MATHGHKHGECDCGTRKVRGKCPRCSRLPSKLADVPDHAGKGNPVHVHTYTGPVTIHYHAAGNAVGEIE